MDKILKTRPFSDCEIDWESLSRIGILHDELEASGELDKLLDGEKTDIMTLHLVLMGADVEMDASLQMVREGEQPKLDIRGIRQLEVY